MAKKLVAVTGIKHNGDMFEAGEPIDPTQFTKAELKELHDNGAIVIEDDAKAEDVKGEDLTPEELGQKGAQTQDVSAPSKEGTATVANSAKDANPAKDAPAKK